MRETPSPAVLVESIAFVRSTRRACRSLLDDPSHPGSHVTISHLFRDDPSALGRHPTPELDVIAAQVLWLSTAMIHHANRVRPNPCGLKVGGHQASSRVDGLDHDVAVVRATSSGDRVSVKPHASPVLHAINYLLGELDERYLTTLREFGGLQSYPSRSKDPDPVDYSTGSVGIGATAPIWGAIARRYVDTTSARRHRPSVLAGRRRRTRRGRDLGGDSRSRRRRTRRDRLDRRHESPVPGPRGAEHRGRSAGDDVRGPPAGR